MGLVGNVALLLSPLMTLFCAVSVIYGIKRGSRTPVERATSGLYVVALLVSLAALALLWSLVSHDFRLVYVAEHTSLSLPAAYAVSAFWSGKEGSLLLWTWMLTVFAAIAIWRTRRRHAELVPYAVLTLAAVETLFVVLSGVISNPFAQLPWSPGDGLGLNPVLQHPVMAIHPPTIFLGFASLTIPFAFAMSSLASGRLDDEWIRASQKYVLGAWLFLTVGNLLGSLWAYMELGWGGFWAWDPIENASLLPWLTTTALLHSLTVQRRRGTFRIWNYGLMIITFGLPILGTFLVRSGFVASVHSYAASSVGMVFLALLGLIVLPPSLLLVRRLSQLRQIAQTTPTMKERAFLLNNAIFSALAALIFLGTVFPPLWERLVGQHITLGPSFFNAATGPVFLALLMLMGICPLIRWYRDTAHSLSTHARYPLLATAVFASCAFIVGVREGWALLGFSTCAFIVAATAADWTRGIIERRRAAHEDYAQAFASSMWANRPKYVGYVVHIGVALVALGIVGSSFYHSEIHVTLARGETVSIQGYVVRYEGMTQHATTDSLAAIATFSVQKDHQLIGTLTSQADFHPNSELPTVEPGIRSTLLEDLYLVMEGWENNGETVVLSVMVNRLLVWLWIGSVVVAAGATMALWPAPYVAPSPRRQPARPSPNAA